MPENPLLPDNELRALLELTKSCLKLDAGVADKEKGAKGGRERRLRFSPPRSREALLAATALQLKAGDLLVPEPGDSVAARLMPAMKPGDDGETGRPEPDLFVPELRTTASHLLLAAAMAAAVKAQGGDALVVAYARAGGSNPDWADALRWAQVHLLPLVLVCSDSGGRRAFGADSSESTATLNWQAVDEGARQLGLPVLCVDGEDAVAVYRVMQESALRARSGAGPAVLWAMLPSKRDLSLHRPTTASPVVRLQRYLRSRKIAVR